MAKKQVTVSKHGIMEEVLAEAQRTWDDADTEGEAFKRALVDWFRNRQTNSKRGSLARLEDNAAHLIAVVDQLERNDAHLIATTTQMSARMLAYERNMIDLMRIVKK